MKPLLPTDDSISIEKFIEFLKALPPDEANSVSLILQSGTKDFSHGGSLVVRIDIL